MPTLDLPTIEDLLQKFGLSTDSLSRLKLGRGVAGNMTTIGVVSLICLTLVAYSMPLWQVRATAIVMIAGITLYLLFRLEKLAREKPDIAMLEGAEFLLYHHKRLGLGTKGSESSRAERAEPYQAPRPPSEPPSEPPELLAPKES
ncbi:MAG: hypothetical protein ACYDC3_13830 [Candidatus Binataceae bacterium]